MHTEAEPGIDLPKARLQAGLGGLERDLSATCRFGAVLAMPLGPLLAARRVHLLQIAIDPQRLLRPDHIPINDAVRFGNGAREVVEMRAPVGMEDGARDFKEARRA